MSQQQSVIYLPPGVAAPGAVPSAPAPAGLPFDRTFFERVLPQAVGGFASHVSCGSPVVEVTTVDGTTHYVQGISGVADRWVALHVTHEDEDGPSQVFIPYQTIFRVEIDPCSDIRPRKLGFVLNEPEQVPVVLPAEGDSRAG
ncbi:MAG: hypothetical protein ACE5EF_01395 [Dehalococcoidia bacterium]